MRNAAPFQLLNLLLPLALSLALLSLNHYLSLPHFIEDKDAVYNEFSALRAQSTLKKILDKQTPHPVGSQANKAVKQRILGYLNNYGLEVSEQRVFACSKNSSSCAWVENIAGRLNPAQENQLNPSVTLMAHYDSVPLSPGAGDDGAGVAVILEIARILSAGERPLNPVIFLFTDGEEFGLLGAEAYFSEHPWAKTAAVVLNLEGSGSSGNSNLLRTGHDNLDIIAAYQQSVSHYAAQSLVTEIFKRMPNDTDFSVVQRANLQGLDFAFAEQRNHYHTPLDTIQNLDLATIQHHGDNLFPLSGILANTRLGEMSSGDSVYQSLFGSVLITWNQSHTWRFLLACILITIVIIYRTRNQYSAAQVFAGSALVIAVIVSVSIVNYLAFKLVRVGNSTMVSFPASTWPYYLLITGSMLTGGILPVLRARRFQTYWSSTLGLWIFWLLLACTLTLLVPAAANLVILPTLAALMVLLVSSLRTLIDNKTGWICAATLNLLIVTPFTLGMVAPLIESQGLNLVIVCWLSLGLYMATLVPMIHLFHPRSWVLVMTIGLVLITAGAAVALSTPLYSVDRPQHINIYHIQDDNQNAWWVLASANPIPTKMRNLYDFRTREQSVLPWQPKNAGPVAKAPLQAMPAPELRILSDSSEDSKRELVLEFRSMRQANFGLILIPDAVKLISLQVEGIQLPVDSTRQKMSGYRRIHLAAMPAEGVRIEFTTSFTGPINVLAADWISELPEFAAALEQARQPLGVPVHQGDQSLIFTHINI